MGIEKWTNSGFSFATIVPLDPKSVGLTVAAFFDRPTTRNITKPKSGAQDLAYIHKVSPGYKKVSPG